MDAILQQPSSGLDFSFDFCEICGGSGVVSKEAAALGLIVCTPIDLSDSRHFDLKICRLMEWISYMLMVGKIRSIMCELPCTSFSPAAHPAVRSYQEPLGYNRLCWKTWLGNLLAFRCMILMMVAVHFDRPALAEQPFLSKMAWLSIWRFLRGTWCAEASIASCAFGSVHLKKFRLLSYRLDSSRLQAACPGGHKHIRIEGKYTKPSAVYVPKLAKRFALVFRDALKKQALDNASILKKPEIESVLANDVLSTGQWRVEVEWCWRSHSHINILESHAYLTLIKRLALRGGDRRSSALLDSQVAKSSHAKGRSSSRALLPTLRKAAALQAACGLYGSLNFSPTRLNVADDPTRDALLRLPSERSCTEHLTLLQLQRLHSSQFSRPVASWIRFILLFGFTLSPVDAVGHLLSNPASSPSFKPLTCSWILFLLCGFALLACAWSDFRTGPSKPRICLGKQWFHRSRCPLFLFACSLPVSAMDVSGTTPADRERADGRSGTTLFADRVLRPQTRHRREDLLGRFDFWLREAHGLSVNGIIATQWVDSDLISRMLVEYDGLSTQQGNHMGLIVRLSMRLHLDVGH